MKKQFPFLFFLFLVFSIHAQKEAAFWYFGRNAGLDFNSGAPVALTDGMLNTWEGCATISDTAGVLLFYTDGITVYNRNHAIMPNGTGLKGDDSSTNSAIIVPKPNDSNIYYIFTSDATFGPDGLNFSEIDLSLNGGLGDVTSNKNIQLQTRVAEKLTAIKVPGENAYWMVAHKWGSSEFVSYKITNTGVNTVPVISSVGTLITWPFERSQGALKISPDGKKIAMASLGIGVELFDFDANTGMISNATLITDPYLTYGVEFSSNSKVLYVTSFVGDLEQFDLEAGTSNDIKNSRVILDDIHGGALQLAIDGKIYVARDNYGYLGIINNPNVLGTGCFYQADGVFLNGQISSLGLPPFIQSFFKVDFTVSNFCLGDTTSFTIDSSEPITSISWDFGDGNSSTLESPNHSYAYSGDYTISVTVTTATETTTDTKDITIYKVPVAHPVTNYEICTDSPTYAFDLSTKDAEVLATQNVAEFRVTYFSSLLDAENNTNVLPNLYTNTLATETIYARIQNMGNSACFDTTSFDLIVQKAPVVNTQHDWTVCDTDLDGFHTFDLSQKTTSILQNNDPAEFNVSYYLSQADLDNKTNPIAINYTNTVAREEIYWRIENSTHPTCYGAGTFFLEVISGVTAHTPTHFEVCDDNNDGLYSFDLTQKESEILGGQNPASILVTYHPTLVDAENDSNLLSTAYTNSTPYNETIFVRVENTADANCYDTTHFELQITDSPMVQTVTNWRACDADNDGLYLFNLQTKEAEILGNQSSINYSISFYETQADADAITNAITGLYENISNPQTVFYRIEHRSNGNCYSTGDFGLEVYDAPVANVASPMVTCDSNESGSSTFDLSQKDQEILNGQNPATFQVAYFLNEGDAINNQNSLSKTNYQSTNLDEVIYARVQHSSLASCYALSNFPISIHPLPQPNLEEQYVICPDSPELTIDGGDFESWVWRDANNNTLVTGRLLNVATLGNFSLTVSDSPNGFSCEKTVYFEVVSSGAPEDFTTEISDFSDQVTIEVDVIGTGDFEYSTDGEHFQNSNRLEVFPGTHTIYVRDQFLCRTISKEVIALGFQKFFTPNGDGTHEYWNVIGAENFPKSQIFIFDRQGKLLQQLAPESRGWDGTFQGIQMPATDYWFRFVNEDGSEHSGHFSLKR